MTDLKTWVDQLKTEQPELSDFITKLEVFISDIGFNSAKFEKAVDTGLKNIETKVIKSFNPINATQNQKNNN